MFNAPRLGQRYTTNYTNGLGGSFVDENPLANSVYDDGLDPWSAQPSPAPTPIPRAPPASAFSSVIGDATIPLSYNRAFLAVDPANSGEISVNALSRVLATSALPAAIIDKIVNLVSSRTRVSRVEFFVALALVALAQTGKDVSIEQVAALGAQNTLPEPIVDLDKLPPSMSTFPAPVRMPTYSEDPWSTNPRYPSAFGNASAANDPFTRPPVGANGVTSSLSGSGLPKDWWKKQETVKVNFLGHQGFILNRYMVYEISTDRGPSVTRRYSEFVILWECLLRRYPFRLFPALPPKRIGPDEHFLEQRRRGLTRALNFVVNHPVIKDDGLLAVFLTETSFEIWRKNNVVSFEEESASKRVDKIEEMTIPSDLEDKIAFIRGNLNPLIEQWQRICILAERIIRRRESAAVRMPSTFRGTFFPTHFALLSSHPHSAMSIAESVSSDESIIGSMVGSIMGTSDVPHIFPSEQQSDFARLTNTLRAVVEVNERCWRSEECELTNGVNGGLEQLALHTQRASEISETRTQALLNTSLEALKSQRDLYLATRDLFIRHDRFSMDHVDKLKKRVETNSVKLDGTRTAQKEGWQEEVERLGSVIEKDQGTIAAQLSRRLFIRACMWHELRVVLHNRENTLLSQAVQTFAREEHMYTESVLHNWASLCEAVESMPYE